MQLNKTTIAIYLLNNHKIYTVFQYFLTSGEATITIQSRRVFKYINDQTARLRNYSKSY